MAEIEWSEASQDVIHLAEDIIKDHHPLLREARICFVFRSEPQKTGNRYILGAAMKVPAKLQPVMEFDFLIWLAEREFYSMEETRQIALIDHQLTHCGGFRDNWTIRQHDFSDFTEVVRRHGFYDSDLFRMGEAAAEFRQSSLFDDTSVTVSSGGKVATMTGAEFDRATRKITG